MHIGSVFQVVIDGGREGACVGPEWKPRRERKGSDASSASDISPVHRVGRLSPWCSSVSPDTLPDIDTFSLRIPYSTL